MPAFLASSRYQYALALRARGQARDEDRAEWQLEEALALATRLGIHFPTPSGALRLRPARPAAHLPLPAADRTDNQASDEREAVLREEGEYWTVAWRGTTFRLRHSIGLAYLARLLDQPDREVHALDLVVLVRPGTRSILAEQRRSDAGPILDAQAKAAYRRRLHELAEELEEAEAWGDPERAAAARVEIDALTQQLTAAVGLSGRDRAAGSSAERARVSVTKAIRGAIRRIAERDPLLGDHLRRSVRTGTFCAYASDPTRPITWRL